MSGPKDTGLEDKVASTTQASRGSSASRGGVTCRTAPQNGHRVGVVEVFCSDGAELEVAA